MQHLIPYTPQENGVAKRKNRSLKEMATYMMEAKTLPPKFWEEAIKCASCIQNRVPHKHIDGMNPFEAWSEQQARCDPFQDFWLKSLG